MNFTFRHSILIQLDEDGDYLVRSPELRGCMAHGATVNEALVTFREIYDLWIEARRDSGLPIPEPLTLDEFMAIEGRPK